MVILGLDPAQQCGWALYDTASSSLSSIKAGVIKASGESYEEKAATLGRGLVKLLTADRDKATGKPILPAFVAIEMPIRTQPGRQVRKVKFMGEEQVEEASGSGLNAVISSNQMVGAVCAIIGAYGIPFETVATVTWRSQFLGFGRRAGWQRKDWKKAVRDRCNQFRITVTNDDMADAVGIAFAGKACQSFRMISARAA
jgi:Holliday junction resolvasome RuvABC endonuclease subunit